MSLMQTLTEMINSILAYIGAFKWEEVIASAQLILNNINMETFRGTLETFKGFISSLGSLFG